MNNTTLKKSNEIENSKIFESSNPQIIESSLLTLSSTGGGACQDISVVGRKQQFSQSNGANSAVGKKLSIVNLQLSEANCPLSIVNCKLSIVHYPLLILLCLLFSLNAWAQGQYFGGGAGTSSDPYQISTVTHLNNMADHIADYDGWNNKYFIVTADINGFEKIIGNNTHKFSGNFDGGNHTINLNINVVSASSPGGGLFGQLSGAVIKNVIVTGSITYNITSVGGIVGLASDASLIENCENHAVPNDGGGNRGGIVGACFSSTIRGCMNYADINCSSYDAVGGIVGYVANESNIENCTNYGEIAGRGKVGGIVGESAATNYPTSIINCVNTAAATITGADNYNGTNVGGIVGYSSSSNSNYATSWTSFSECKNYASVSGWGSVGGILGYFKDSRTDYTITVSSMTDCINTGTVTANYGNVGGLIGQIPAVYGYLIIDKCANTGSEVKSTNKSKIGGLVGLCGNPAKVYNSYNTANVSCTGNLTSDELYMGGLIGELSQNSTVNNCYNIGDVISNGNSGSYIGGIVGNCNGKMSNSYNGGTVSNSGSNTGGIAGYRLINSELKHCYPRNNCGTNGGINVMGSGASGASLYMSRPFNHSDYNNNKLTDGVTVNGTPYGTSVNFYEILNAWVDSANNGGDTYYTWVDASSNDDNKGMPKFFTCTPVPDPSLSVTQTNTGGRELQVSWTATTGVSYTLYYGVNDPNSGLENVYNAGAQTSPYNALRLTNGVEYHFAIKPTGTGDYCADNPLSSTVSATPECNE